MSISIQVNNMSAPSAQKKPLILVDGSSYLYRAFHAMPALVNSKGEPTGAAYGVINMLKRLLADYQPEHIAVVFDAKGRTFRDDLYSEYKATRKEMPPELAQQIEPIHQIIRAMGLPLIMIEGVEADDVIGTLAKQAAKKGIDSVISTGDKDLAQLVDQHITLINTMTNTTMNPQGVQEKFGVPPERIIDYLTLVGDTSDNIPGVPQVGPKTAVKWLQEYGTLDNIIANASKITGKVGEKFRAFIEQIPLTKALVTIKCDVALSIDDQALVIKPRNNPLLIELFKKMEFKSWLSELLNATETKAAVNEKATSLTEWLPHLKQKKQIALAIETSNTSYMSAALIGISLAIEPGRTFYINFVTAEGSELVLLKTILEDKEIKKVGHNLKHIIEILANEGINLEGTYKDVMLESYILDSSGNNHNDVHSLALKYLGIKTDAPEELASIILQLDEALWPRIQQESGLKYVLETIETPLIPVLADIERTGVLINPDLLKQQEKELKIRLAELEKETFELAGEEFNLGSPKQLQEILFQKLNLPILQKTPTGQPSTADPVLQELALDFAIPKLIIEHRSLSKLMSTYTSRLVEQINPATKRIHTSYNQTGAATGRLSSSEPNLQNIPIRTHEGRRIRQAFIAAPGYMLVSADYSQIELRLMAHISEDPSLLKAFANNLDIHTATASEVWGVPLAEVSSDLRRQAKAINFGLIYGMSAFGLTRQLGIDRKSAQEYIDRYFARYPNVRAYMDNTRAQAKQHGYVETLWGRRLYLPEINASQIPRQKAAERAAINAPLQGSAADIIKLAMINVHHWLKEQPINARMIMQVHDELVFEVKESDVEAFKAPIRQLMGEVVSLKVPLLVSVGTGHNWDEASNH